MKHAPCVTALLLLVGCSTTVEVVELPVEHPAHPGAAASVFSPGPNPFELTTTFQLPTPANTTGEMPVMTNDSSTAPRAGDAGAEQVPTRYTCPMHPEVISATPGNCPECGMALRPMQPAARHAAPGNDPGSNR